MEDAFGTKSQLNGPAKKNGTNTTEKCPTVEDKRDFATFLVLLSVKHSTRDFTTVVLLSVKHSTAHRTRIGDKKKQKARRQRSGPPSYVHPHACEEGPSVQLCGDTQRCAEKWINGLCFWTEKQEYTDVTLTPS